MMAENFFVRIQIIIVRIQMIIIRIQMIIVRVRMVFVRVRMIIVRMLMTIVRIHTSIVRIQMIIVRIQMKLICILTMPPPSVFGNDLTQAPIQRLPSRTPKALYAKVPPFLFSTHTAAQIFKNFVLKVSFLNSVLSYLYESSLST